MGDAAATGARETLEQLTSAIVSHFGSGLQGLYLFGSLAAGGFYPGKSDLDLLAVVAAEVEEGEQLESLRSLHDAFVSSGLPGSSALRSSTWIAGCCGRSVIARAAASP
jgi:predicted nucleotidyltransferase